MMSACSLAQENLYAPGASPDATFVRALHAAPGYEDFIPTVGEEVFGTLEEFGEVSPYFALEFGQKEYTLGDITSTASFEAGRFYTLVFLASEVLILEDEPLIDASRALLNFYNVSELETADLLAGEDETSVFTNVASGQVVSLAVNEADIALSVVADGELVTQLRPVMLERGVAHSVFLINGNDGAYVFYEPASVTVDSSLNAD